MRSTSGVLNEQPLAGQTAVLFDGLITVHTNGKTESKFTQGTIWIAVLWVAVCRCVHILITW